MNANIQYLQAQLADVFPEGGVTAERRTAHDRLWLPKAPGADYCFYIEAYDAEGNATMAAQLEGQSEDALFWHLPMHYRPEEEREALDALVQDVQRLAMNESRIMQRRGLLLWRFWCEVKEGDARKRLGGTVACLRWGYVVPASSAKTREYRSEPLRSRG